MGTIDRVLESNYCYDDVQFIINVCVGWMFCNGNILAKKIIFPHPKNSLLFRIFASGKNIHRDG